jgi:hypothetical protein
MKEWNEEPMTRIVKVEDYGIKPNSGQDASFAVYMALEQCRNYENATLLFEKGRYDFWPDQAFEQFYCISNHGNEELKRCALPLIGCRHITVDGAGSDFVFHGKINPFVIDRSQNVTLKRFTIDWERPMLSQGEIMQVDDCFVDVHIPEIYPFEVVNGKLIFIGEGWKNEWNGLLEMDASTRSPAYRSADRPLGMNEDSFTVKPIGPGLIRLEGDVSRRPKTGNMLIFKHAPRVNPGIFISDSVDTHLSDIHIYSANGMGIIAQKSENIILQGIHVIPNPLTTRMFSVSADATHFVYCKGLVQITACTFHNQMDDPLNIHGIYGRIARRIDDRTLLIELVHKEQKGVDIVSTGERIRLLRRDSFVEYGTFTVQSCRKLNIDYFLISVERDLPADVSVHDAIENMSWVADLVLSGCTMSGNRGRGPLITTPGKAVIEHNTISAPGAGILIEGDMNYWFESGMVGDITIRHNTFLECTYCPQWGKAVIIISPKIEMPVKEGFHRNISIVDNVFHVFDSNVLKAAFVNGLEFTGNTIVDSEAYEKHGTGCRIIDISECFDVRISGNVSPVELGMGLVNGENVDITQEMG